jgi:hypothetical protein
MHLIEQTVIAGIKPIRVLMDFWFVAIYLI